MARRFTAKATAYLTAIENREFNPEHMHIELFDQVSNVGTPFLVCASYYLSLEEIFNVFMATPIDILMKCNTVGVNVFSIYFEKLWNAACSGIRRNAYEVVIDDIHVLEGRFQGDDKIRLYQALNQENDEQSSAIKFIEQIIWYEIFKSESDAYGIDTSEYHHQLHHINEIKAHSANAGDIKPAMEIPVRNHD